MRKGGRGSPRGRRSPGEDGPMGPEVNGVYGVHPAAAVNIIRRHVLRNEPHRNLHEHGGRGERRRPADGDHLLKNDEQRGSETTECPGAWTLGQVLDRPIHQWLKVANRRRTNPRKRASTEGDGTESWPGHPLLGRCGAFVQDFFKYIYLSH